MKEPFSEKWKRFKMQLKCGLKTRHKNRYTGGTGDAICRDCTIIAGDCC